VQLATRHTFRVTVSGEVTKPGAYEIPAAQCDLLAALVAAGGMTKQAGDVVEVKHPVTSNNGVIQQASYDGEPPSNFRSMRFDLTQASAARKEDFSLVDGSRVMVIKRPPESIQVIGLVRQPGQFEHPADQQLRLLDAIALAGGLTLQIADKVRVIRTPQGSDSSIVIAAKISRAKLGGEENIRLQPGDVVSVEETPTTFVLQTMKDFFRFGFSSAVPGL
jgi:polysaccharide export outer membrane protein